MRVNGNKIASCNQATVDSSNIRGNLHWHCNRSMNNMLLVLTPMFAAAGWALLYLIFGGGFGGALLIFIVLKMFGR
jgi:hypothetical protein